MGPDSNVKSFPNYVNVKRGMRGEVLESRDRREEIPVKGKPRCSTDNDSGTFFAEDTPLLGLGTVAATLLSVEEAEDTAAAFLAP
jgi:hypothetical protein